MQKKIIIIRQSIHQSSTLFWIASLILKDLGAYPSSQSLLRIYYRLVYNIIQRIKFFPIYVKIEKNFNVEKTHHTHRALLQQISGKEKVKIAR
jgi:hypothetical protein